MKRGSKDLCDTISPQGKKQSVDLITSYSAAASPYEKIYTHPFFVPW